MSSPLILINHWSSIPWATSSTIWAIIYPCHQTFINDFLSIHENYSHYILFYPSNTSSILVVKYAMILHWLILYSQFTTPRHYIPNHQIGWENGFHRQKVGREWVLPTDLVGHRKSSRENPFPTNNILPTDCSMAIGKFSRPTFLYRPTFYADRQVDSIFFCRPTSRQPKYGLFPTNCSTLVVLPTNNQTVSSTTG